MFGDDAPGPAPYIPAGALQRPAGATVDAAGQVRCVVCQTQTPLAKADVVGMGYRCAPCSHKAELALLTGGGDGAAHFTASERKGLVESGMLVVFAGIGVMVLGLLLLVVLAPYIRWGVIALVGGGSMIGAGLARRNAAN